MTTKTILTEGLDYHDLEGQMVPVLTVDEYSAKMGTDSEIVTLAFMVNSEAAGNDVADWFERGYDFVLDAQVSEGEVKPGKYLVFVEMNRRTSVPERIVELIQDLETLTAKPIKDWTIKVNEEEHPAEVDILKQVIIVSPHVYREKKEKDDEDINKVRELSGLEPVNNLKEQDEEIKSFKAIAGL